MSFKLVAFNGVNANMVSSREAKGHFLEFKDGVFSGGGFLEKREKVGGGRWREEMVCFQERI